MLTISLIELDDKEIGLDRAWTRVLTYEIMNSVTPINSPPSEDTLALSLFIKRRRDMQRFANNQFYRKISFSFRQNPKTVVSHVSPYQQTIAIIHVKSFIDRMMNCKRHPENWICNISFRTDVLPADLILYVC